MRINLNVSADVEQKFRDAVYRKLGMKKGNIQIAVVEALEDWTAKVNLEEKKKR